VAIGSIGFVVDSMLTYILVQVFGMDHFVARLPAFSVATVVNFTLNRALTFTDSTTPLLIAFKRYVAVCAVGLVVNFFIYAGTIALATKMGFDMSPKALPFFVACGAGGAMFVTFFGFRLFAFRR
jgi:putative flippase GtrA